ncbi:MAG TPA: hypothetical protein VGL09_06645 [Methylomirabilota bacterium]|jgi:hypothetical protein
MGHRWELGVLLLAAVAGTQGCAALAIAPLASAAVSSGTGAIVKAGTEYRGGGVVMRTFVLPMSEVHRATITTLREVGMQIEEDTLTDVDGKLVARGRHRVVEAKFEAIAPRLTRLQVKATGRLWTRDGATASELVAETEETVERFHPGALTRRVAPQASR